jgi:dihydrofolate reductase
MKTELVLVVAVASNGCIGQNNQLPWHIPEDLKHFKAITTGHPVLMGRKTYQSILDHLGKPLPNRHHFVLSRQADWRALPEHQSQVEPVSSVEQALWQAEMRNEPALMVVGGADVYAQTLALADRIEMTEVLKAVDGDAFFPSLTDSDWQTTILGEGQTPDGLAYRFCRLTRQAAPIKA